MKKLLIIGHAQHGKDTAAGFLRDLYGYKFKGSSVAASEIFLYDKLKEKYGYTSPEQCFEDRVNHRSEWYDLICEYNKDDKAALAKVIMKDSNIYVGMRSNVECEECLRQGIFDLVIGIWNPRKNLEHKGSFDIDIWEKSDIIIPNSGSLADLGNRLILIEPLLKS